MREDVIENLWFYKLASRRLACSRLWSLDFLNLWFRNFRIEFDDLIPTNCSIGQTKILNEFSRKTVDDLAIFNLKGFISFFGSLLVEYILPMPFNRILVRINCISAGQIYSQFFLCENAEEFIVVNFPEI